MNFLKEAIEYHQAGLKVIPFWNEADGKKRFPYGYAKFRTAQTAQDVGNLFAGDVDGVCMLCVDGIEAVDLDVKHDPKGTIGEDLLQAIEDFGFTMPAIVQKTKSGGLHIIYRCPAPEGNLKLARRAGEKEAVIETRGAGGLLFVAPTPGYELQNASLTRIMSGDVDVTQEQRDQLIALCRHFDETQVVDFEEKTKPELEPEVKPDPEPKSAPAILNNNGKKCWEAYDESTDAVALMEHYGWRVVSRAGDYVRLNRPGAKHKGGVDGSVIVSKNVFYVFTSSEVFEPNKGYSPSAVYAVMEHRGDFSEAAKAMYRQGYGDRIEHAPEAQQDAQPEEGKLPALLAKVQSSRFDFSRKEAEPLPLLRFEGSRTASVAGRGMIGVLTGHEKSGKSFVGACIAASALKGGECLNFRLNLYGGKLLWFDTEQGRISFDKTQRRIYRMAGLDRDCPYYEAFCLRQFSPQERIEAIEHVICNTPGVSVVMIDGFVDLIKDYNDLTAVNEYVNRLMRWSDEKQILILGVLHVNKGDGKIRGHIGSELKNKCDFIVNVSRSEQGEYLATNPTNRNYMNFPDMPFTRDHEGLPVYDDTFGQSFRPGPASTQFPTTQPTYIPQPVPRMNEEDIPF